jgi:cobalt/nickel transport system permease protein
MLGRVVCSLAVLVLLTRSTPWLRLMSALGALGLPRAMVMIATMAHRYLIVLADVLADHLLARRARTVSGTRGRDDRAFVGASVAALLTRASALADEVHQAMVARGYDGRPPRGPAAAGRPTAGVRLRTAAASGALLVPAILLVIGDVLAR